MKRYYSCPHCEAILNPDAKIILGVEKKGEKGKRRLILFSPRPGDYSAVLAPDLALTDGDRVEFHCPLCAGDLVSPRGEEWAEINFRTSGKSEIEGEALFSTTFGRHATCFITKEEQRWYGEDAQENLHFWESGPVQEH